MCIFCFICTFDEFLTVLMHFNAISTHFYAFFTPFFQFYTLFSNPWNNALIFFPPLSLLKLTIKILKIWSFSNDFLFELTLDIKIFISKSANLLPRHILGPWPYGSDANGWRRLSKLDCFNQRSGLNSSGSLKYWGIRPKTKVGNTSWVCDKSKNVLLDQFFAMSHQKFTHPFRNFITAYDGILLHRSSITDNCRIHPVKEGKNCTPRLSNLNQILQSNSKKKFCSDEKNWINFF